MSIGNHVTRVCSFSIPTGQTPLLLQGPELMLLSSSSKLTTFFVNQLGIASTSKLKNSSRQQLIDELKFALMAGRWISNWNWNTSFILIDYQSNFSISTNQDCSCSSYYYYHYLITVNIQFTWVFYIYLLIMLLVVFLPSVNLIKFFLFQVFLLNFELICRFCFDFVWPISIFNSL